MSGTQERTNGENLYYGDLQVRAMPGVHSAAVAALQEFAPPNCRLLEVGSGAGALTSRLHENGFDVTASGIDPDDYKYTGVPFLAVDLSRPIAPELTGAFEAVVATEVIEHVENIFLFLRNAHDLLAPRGVLVLTTPNAVSLFSRLQFLKTGRIAFCNEELMKSWGHIQIIPEWFLKKAASDAGFECVKTAGVGTRRYDLAPRWHRWVDALSSALRHVIRQEFDGELKGSNLLMVLRRR